MSIQLTPSAAQEIRQLLSEQPDGGKGLCLHVGVKSPESRPSYTLELSEPGAGCRIVAESQGIGISCREEDLARLDGVTIDFRDLGATRGFIFQPPAQETGAAGHKAGAGAPSPDEQHVRQALHDVIDPEVGVNIVDLGLVYGIATDGRRVRITMTMTTPACPLSEQVKREINARLLGRCPGVEGVEVEIVWDPPWGPEKMSAAAKQALGWSR